MISTVIFDMNGVIVDDEHLHELAFHHICLEFNITLSHKDYIDLCMGRTDKEGFEMIIDKFSINHNIDDLIIKKSKKYLDLIQGYIKVYPNILTVIRNLSKDFKLALNSSSDRNEINMILSTLKIQHFFATIVSANDIENGKPHPEPYLTTAKRLNENPENCLVIEDTKNGVLSAKTAGMKCVAITTTCSRDHLINADIIIEDFLQLTNEFITKVVAD